MKLNRLMLPTGIKNEISDTLANLFDWSLEVKNDEIFLVTDGFEMILRDVDEYHHTPWALTFCLSQLEFDEFLKRLDFFQFRKNEILTVEKLSNEVRLRDREGNYYQVKKVDL